MKRRQALGNRGEAFAAAYLNRQGFETVARNYRASIGEIDLVVGDGDELVFVEVKTRVGGPETAPDCAVTASKLERMARLAELYLRQRGTPDVAWRVDVLAIVAGRGGDVRSVDHLRGAFL